MDSRYNELRWIVEVSHETQGVSCFEPMAAFNVGDVAVDYMKRCQAANMEFRYRTIEMPQVERCEPRVIWYGRKPEPEPQPTEGEE